MGSLAATDEDGISTTLNGEWLSRAGIAAESPTQGEVEFHEITAEVDWDENVDDEFDPGYDDDFEDGEDHLDRPKL